MAEGISGAGSSPDIIFNLKGFVYGNTSKENSFVRCKNSFNIVDYLARKDAAIKNSTIVSSDVLMDESLEVMGDWNIASYAANRKGSAGAFTLDKSKLDKEDLRQIMKELRTTRSTVWTSVLSFTPQLAKQFCNSREQAQTILKENLPKLFEGSKLDFDNLRVLAAYHVNTQHPHLHVVFWEKEPTRLSSKGKLTYNYNHPTKKPYLPKECLSNFKFSLAQTFNKNKLDFWSLRDKIRTAVRDDLKNVDHINFLSSMYEQDKDIIENAGKQYGRLSASEKRRIDKSVMEFINRNPQTRKIYELYTSLLMQAHMQNIQILKDNHMPVPERTKNFYDSRMTELRARLGNEYIKNMKFFGETHTAYRHNRSSLLRPPNQCSSSSFMRSIRSLKKPLHQSTSAILSKFEKAVKDSVIVFKNNLDRYFAELRATGVDLIYGEEGQQGGQTEEAFE